MSALRASIVSLDSIVAEPCHDCTLRETCAADSLACADFVQYVNSGIHRPRVSERQPNSVIYDRLFVDQLIDGKKRRPMREVA